MISPAAAFFHVISITYSSRHISWKAAGTGQGVGLSWARTHGPSPRVTNSTWTPLLTAGLHLLACALTRVALCARSLAHAEAALPARVTRLGAQAPCVPRPPLAIGGYEKREF